MYQWLSEIHSYHNSHNQVYFIYIWEAENEAENQSESDFDWFFALFFAFFKKKWFAKKRSEKSIKIGSNLYFNAFFASLFCFAFLLRKLGKNFKMIAIFRVWQTCIFHFSLPCKISRAQKMHWNSQVPKKVKFFGNFNF